MIDDSIIISWLGKYKALPLPLLEKMLPGEDTSILVRHLIAMKNSRALTMDKTGYLIRLNASEKLNPKLIDALWVFSEFAADVGRNNHGPVDYPSQLYFIRGDSGYEIIVLNSNEANHLKIIKTESHTKYILVIPKKEDIEIFDTAISQMPKDSKFREDQYIYASVKRDGVNPVPLVEFHEHS